MSAEALLGPNEADYESTLERAVNNTYEAVIETDEEFDEQEHDEDVIWLREERLKNSDLHWLKRPSVLMIALIIFMYAFSSYSSEATRQVIQFKLACNSLIEESKNGMCDPAESQLIVSNLQMGFNVASNIMMLMLAGYTAPLSDIYGRKLFIFLCIFFLIVGKAYRLFVLSHWNTLHFKSLILAEVLSNLGGGIMSLMSVANCYIADVVEPHQRGYYFGISASSLLVGVSLGPLAGNWIISVGEKFHLKSAKDAASAIKKAEFLPFKFELGVLILLCFIIVFVIPESRSEKLRTKSRSASSANLQAQAQAQAQTTTTSDGSLTNKLLEMLYSVNFLRPLKFLIVPKEFLGSKTPGEIRRIRVAVLIMIFLECALIGIGTCMIEIFILYGLLQFKWNRSQVGNLLAVLCSSKAFGLILLNPVINKYILQKRLKFKPFKKQLDMIDLYLMLIGLFSDIAGFCGLYFARSTTMFMFSIIIATCGTFTTPTLSSTLTKYYPESKVGELFGALALVKNTFGLICPIIFLNLYKFSISKLNWPSFSFAVFGCVYLVAVMLILYIKTTLGLTKDSIPSITRQNSMASFNSQSPQVGNSGPPSPLAEHSRKSSFVNRERNLSSDV